MELRTSCVQEREAIRTSKPATHPFVVNTPFPQQQRIVWTVCHITSQWLCHCDVTLRCTDRLQSFILMSTRQVRNFEVVSAHCCTCLCTRSSLNYEILEGVWDEFGVLK